MGDAVLGNTPTGVGKTHLARFALLRFRKHPHGRGEDAGAIRVLTNHPETPPRAWGRLTLFNHHRIRAGNTPTGVGKTWKPWGGYLNRRKHPHGRGEDRPATSCPRHAQETPPRAWGRLTRAARASRMSGNTPTGVGKTMPTAKPATPSWKHPHGRGEDFGGSHNLDPYQETPPRAWGRPG